MADDEREAEVIQPRGAEWEVVSLTASTYAAAPDPKGFDPNDGDGSGQEASSALFMSDHFVFPPSEHENLPIEPEYSEIQKGEDAGFTEKEGEEEREEKLDDGSQVAEFFDDEATLSASRMELEEGNDIQGLSSVPSPEVADTGNPGRSPDQVLKSPTKNQKAGAGDDFGGSGIPSSAWWKKHASSLYRHAKEANTFWSIVVAAALTGLVILGKRWHRDKCHAQELRRHLCVNDEKMKAVMGPMGRLKNIIVDSHQQSPLVSGVTTSH